MTTASEQTPMTTTQTYVLPQMPEEVSIDIKKLLHLLLRNLWFVVAAGVCGLVVALMIHFWSYRPQYQTSALISVNSEQSNAKGFSMGLGMRWGDNSAIEKEIALIKTGSILNTVIEKNGLNIDFNPCYYPIVGRWMAKFFRGPGLAAPFWGLSSYAWGGEKFKIQYFHVPENMIGQLFRVKVLKHHQFQVFSNAHQLILEGKINQDLSSKVYPGLKLKITKMYARPGTEFSLVYRYPGKNAKYLGRDIKIKNITGLNPQSNTGILQLDLAGSSPEQVERILNDTLEYAALYESQQRTNLAQNELNFIQQQLPMVKDSLNKSEYALSKYFLTLSTVHLEKSSRILIKKYKLLEKELETNRMLQENLLQDYTAKYPAVIALKRREAALKQQLNDCKTQVKAFPYKYGIQELDLRRENKIKNTLYLNMINRIQSLKMIQSGINNNITILNKASPAVKLPSNVFVNSGIGLIIGVFLAVIGVLAKLFLIKTIDDAEDLENEIRTPIRAIIPFSHKQKQLEKNHKKLVKTMGDTHKSAVVLAQHAPDDLAIESLRSLHVNLYFMPAMINIEPRVIGLCGSSPSIGKSFVSLNLAQLTADMGKKTLLIDADVRKGRLHHALARKKSPGLCEFLEGKYQLHDVIHKINENLDFISNGLYTKHPLELFRGQYLKKLLTFAREQYEQVIIDTAPILPVLDGALIGSVCDVILLIVSVGTDDLRSVKQSIKKIKNNGKEVNGIVMNNVKPTTPYGIRQYYDRRYAYGAT